VHIEIDALKQTIQQLERELGDALDFLLLSDEPPLITDKVVQTGGRQDGSLSSRRVICSLGTGDYVDLLRISSVTFRAYAERYGYDLFLSTDWLAPDRAPAWSKVLLVRRLLDEYDEVLWVDADAIFVDISKDIGDLIKDGKDLYLVEHVWEGGQKRSANSGVFLIRSSDWSRRLLDDLWSAEQFVNHPWWENAALLDMLGYELPADVSHPRKVRSTELEARVELVGLEWNSTGGESLAAHPRIRHRGRRPLPELKRQLLADLLTYRRNVAREQLYPATPAPHA
jgi:hypothetical protein